MDTPKSIWVDEADAMLFNDKDAPGVVEYVPATRLREAFEAGVEHGDSRWLNPDYHIPLDEAFTNFLKEGE